MGLLFSFGGRIGRGKFWLGVLIQVLIGIAAAVAIMFLVDWTKVVELGADGQPVLDAAGNVKVDFLSPALTPAYIVYGIVTLLILWISLAIIVKRCHDRGKSGWWALMFLPSLLASLYTYYLMYTALKTTAGTSTEAMTALVLDPQFMAAQAIAGVTGLVAFIWWLVDLGILEGTIGPNRYGPDPRGG